MENCYRYARNPNIRPKAGWPVHSSVESSREITRIVLSAPDIFAVVLEKIVEPVGSIGLMIGKQSNPAIAGDEGEIDYWIGEPYWDQGPVPEVVKELTCFGFEGCQLETLWCGHLDGSEKSKRVQEKCGFHYLRSEIREWPLIQQTLTEHILYVTKIEWEKKRIA